MFASLIPSYWGGSEELWCQTATALAARGHSVSAVFALFRQAPALDRLGAQGVRFHYGTPPPLRWWRRLIHRQRPLTAIFRRALAKERPDLVVFSQCAVANGIPQVLQCQAAAVPCAIINQLVEPLDHPPALQREIDAAYAAARRIWFVSPENRELVATWLNRTLPNATAIPNAYSCPYQSELAWPADTGGLRLALVARLEPEQKGHDLLLDVLARPAWRERPVTVTFFGDGPARQVLASRCAGLALTRILFGGRQNVTDIWRTHHVCLLPSRYEGQSLAMLEAMLHGRPVIATPVGGTRDLVRDGETGFLARRCDAEALAEAMERAWMHRADWPRLGAAAALAARAHVWREPGAEMADRIESLLLDPGQSA